MKTTSMKTTSMKTTLERELKLGAGPRFRLPDLPGERLAPRIFTSLYVDTPDHRLAAAGVTLRRRTEGGRHRWQLKIPHGVARLELEVPVAGSSRRGLARQDGGPDAPPAQLVDLVTASTRGAALGPVATLRSRREGVLVRGARGPVAEVVLDAVQIVRGRRIIGRFREVEIELTGGDEAVLRDLEQMLRAAGATDGDDRPKLLRALGIEPVAPSSPPSTTAPPAEHVRAMIQAQFGLLIAHDPGTRLGADPEELHQMRAAGRRLRVLLRAARPDLEAEWVEPLRDELAWLGDELGAVRDLDVLRQHLSDEIARLDPADARPGARLLRALEVERAQARSGLLAALRSDRYLRLLGLLDEAVRKPHLVGVDVSVEAIAGDAFTRLRRAIRGLGDGPSDEALHGVRIKARRARYAAELAAPVVGKPAERFIDKAKDFQDMLGEHHDAAMARQRIGALARGVRNAAVAFVAGRLLEREIARGPKILDHFPRRWRKLEKRGHKAWR